MDSAPAAGGLLRPRWLATYAALAVVVVAFVLLGRWQLGTWEGKNRDAAKAAAEQKAAQPPVPLEQALRPGQLLDGRRVGTALEVTGRWDGAHQLLVPDRPLGGRDGLWVLTPLLTPAGDAVPVVRGWVPSAKDPATRVPDGTVRVVGVLEPTETDRSNVGVAGGDLPPGQIPSLDRSDLQVALPYDPLRVYDGFLALRSATSTTSAADPAPIPLPVSELASQKGTGTDGLRNLAYALQWWLFAGAAIWFVVQTARTEVRERREAELARLVALQDDDAADADERVG
ncbi:MAG: SURF1 family protein [Motilibacteraceae bacterium]